MLKVQRFRIVLLLIAASCWAWAQPGPKIVVTSLSPEQMSELKSAAPAARFVAVDGAEAAMKEIADADALLGTYASDVVRAGKRLKWVQSYSAGVSRAPFEYMIERDITLTNCKIIQGPEIADHAFAMLLFLTRRINDARDSQRRGTWERGDYRTPGRRPVELNTKTALIIGLGGIGAQIAQRAHAFGMKVIGIDPKDIPYLSFVDATYHPDQLDELIPQADVIFMSAPLTPETEGMLGQKQFESVKRGSYFIAVSRGMTYDTEAMMKALDEKRLAGAGLDVTNPEPLPDGHPLWKFDNVIITPHIAGQSDLIWDRRMALLKENVRRFTQGRALLNVVDKQRRY